MEEHIINEQIKELKNKILKLKNDKNDIIKERNILTKKEKANIYYKNKYATDLKYREYMIEKARMRKKNNKNEKNII